MACYRPIRGYRRADGTLAMAEGKSGSVGAQEVPCGQCVGCRLERSRQWAMRCLHESQMHKENSFITLTYNDDCLPVGNTLVYRDYQLFMKRLRKRFSGKNIRFYMCGEYGEQTARPHYHSILFGCDFPDKKRQRKSSDGSYLFTSDILSELWPLGNSLIGSVTFESAAYVARYCMAKVTGDLASDHCKSVNIYTGECLDRVPEFNHMSLKPGIGATWFEKYRGDVFPRNYVVVNGKKVKPPKYYDKIFEKACPIDAEVFKYERSLDVNPADNTLDRLAVREQVTLARSSQLIRPME